MIQGLTPPYYLHYYLPAIFREATRPCDPGGQTDPTLQPEIKFSTFFFMLFVMWCFFHNFSLLRLFRKWENRNLVVFSFSCRGKIYVSKAASKVILCKSCDDHLSLLFQCTTYTFGPGCIHTIKEPTTELY